MFSNNEFISRVHCDPTWLICYCDKPIRVSMIFFTMNLFLSPNGGILLAWLWILLCNVFLFFIILIVLPRLYGNCN